MRRGAVLLIALLIALTTTAARAFVTGRNYDGRLRRWPDELPRIRFVANTQSLSLIPNLTQPSLIEAAITGAAQAWSIAPVAVEYGGSVDTMNIALDGRNLITFADTPQNRDFRGDAAFRPAIWSTVRGGQAVILEAEIVGDPTQPFATDGRPDAFDLQAVLTRCMAWTVGLDHSAIAAASAYAFLGKGETQARSLEPDDVAGLRSLYGVTDPSLGSIVGYVMSTKGQPMFGAHVVATDQNGVAQVGVLTSKDGHFTIPYLPPGEYQVYAEPLDGPTTPDNVSFFYTTARTRFRTTFAGGNAAPAAVPVAAGQVTDLDTIPVQALIPTFNVELVGWSVDGITFVTRPGAIQVGAGTSGYLLVAGESVDKVPDLGFRTAGSDLILDTSRVRRSSPTDMPPSVVIPMSVLGGARSGARNLYLANGLERAALTGCIEVVSP